MASELPKEWWDDTTTPPPRDRKPGVGEKVLVEATLTHDKWHRDTVLIAVGDYMNIKVPLSSIHPMPGKKKCPVGCVCQSCLSE